MFGMSELPNRWIVEHHLTVRIFRPPHAEGGDGPMSTMKPSVLLALIPFVAAILSLLLAWASNRAARLTTSRVVFCCPDAS
jgi:hypothetical protein